MNEYYSNLTSSKNKISSIRMNGNVESISLTSLCGKRMFSIMIVEKRDHLLYLSTTEKERIISSSEERNMRDGL